MLLNRKNYKHLIFLTLLTALIGTIAWLIVESIFHRAGIQFSLATGKIGIELQIISLFINVNLGTLLGLPFGWILFKKI